MVERSKRKHNQSWQPLLGSKFVFSTFFFRPFGAKAFLGLVQGLPFQKALEKGFWCLVKGLKDMNSTNATSSRNRKPAWADMQTPQPEKPLKEKAKDEPMDEEKEEDEWWHRDWKRSHKSWDEWWKHRQNEWDEWKKWEKEQEKEKEQQNEKRKMEEEKAAKREDLQTEDSEVEKEVLQGPPAKWKNRNGSTKERAKGRWAEKRAEEVGEDPQLFRLASFGGSRMRRLVNRQEERASMKETVEAALAASQQATAAAQAAQLSSWSWQQAYQQAYQQSWHQQAYQQDWQQQQAYQQNWQQWWAEGLFWHFFDGMFVS